MLKISSPLLYIYIYNSFKNEFRIARKRKKKTFVRNRFCKKAYPRRVEYHEVSRGTCSNINKATPLIIFHRWQKEQNPNRWRIRGLLFFYRPLIYFYSFFYFEIGRKSIEGMIDIGQMAQTRSHLFRYFALEERKKNRIRVASRMQDERSSPVNFYIKRFDFPLRYSTERENYKKRNNFDFIMIKIRQTY